VLVPGGYLVRASVSMREIAAVVSYLKELAPSPFFFSVILKVGVT